jgi:hypothetical protein
MSVASKRTIEKQLSLKRRAKQKMKAKKPEEAKEEKVRR